MKERISYAELVQMFRDHEGKHPEEHLTGILVFTEDSFEQTYSLAARTYLVSSDNKAYQPKMGGYSIYGACADGTDPMVRLEKYMAAEQGGKNGWKVEYCYLAEKIDRNSDRISVDGHTGTWYVIDEGIYRTKQARRDVRCYLLEREQYGEDAAHVIVDNYGALLLDDVYNGFDDLIEADWIKCETAKENEDG